MTSHIRSYAQLRRKHRNKGLATTLATAHISWGDLDAIATFCDVPLPKVYSIAKLVEMGVAEHKGK